MMTQKEIESIDNVSLTARIADVVFRGTDIRIIGEGSQRKATWFGHSDCPDWTGKDIWQVRSVLVGTGFRVNFIECVPNVGEVIIVEHTPKNPKKDRIEVVCYYGLCEGVDSCEVALCRAALMALTIGGKIKGKL